MTPVFAEGQRNFELWCINGYRFVKVKGRGEKRGPLTQPRGVNPDPFFYLLIVETVTALFIRKARVDP